MLTNSNNVPVTVCDALIQVISVGGPIDNSPGDCMQVCPNVRRDGMPRPIVDGADIQIDSPDETYFEMFGRRSEFSVDREAEGIATTIMRSGDDKW